MFNDGDQKQLSALQAKDVPLRLLAHLGDAVFELFEREREVLSAPNAERMHQKVVRRVNAASQADILERLMPHLSEEESDIVRRARNMKVPGNRKMGQATYRYSTAFEALIGFLYLTDASRLRQLLDLSLDNGAQPGSPV